MAEDCRRRCDTDKDDIKRHRATDADAQGCVQAQQGEDCICDERLEQVQGVKVFHGLVQGDCRQSDGSQAAAVRGVRSDWQVNRGVRPKGRAAASVMELVNTVREAAGFEEE